MDLSFCARQVASFVLSRSQGFAKKPNSLSSESLLLGEFIPKPTIALSGGGYFINGQGIAACGSTVVFG